MRHNTQFFVEYFALDLLMNSDGKLMNNSYMLIVGFYDHKLQFLSMASTHPM